MILELVSNGYYVDDYCIELSFYFILLYYNANTTISMRINACMLFDKKIMGYFDRTN